MLESQLRIAMSQQHPLPVTFSIQTLLPLTVKLIAEKAESKLTKQKTWQKQM